MIRYIELESIWIIKRFILFNYYEKYKPFYKIIFELKYDKKINF